MVERLSARPWLKSALTQLLVLAALFFLGRHLVSNWRDLAPTLQQFRAGYVVTAFLLTLIMDLLMPLGWIRAMRWVGVPLPVGAGLRIYYRSSILRYIPGSLWYLPSRAYLCSQRGIPAAAFARSAVLELMMSLLVGGALGGAALARSFAKPWLLVVAGAGVTGLALLLLAPARLLHWFTRGNVEGPSGRRSDLILMVVIYLGVWIAYGAAIWVLLPGLGGGVILSSSSFFRVVEATAAAWIAGFISPVPTGIGVREAALAGLLGGMAPSSFLVLVSLAQRSLELLADAGTWLAANFVREPR